MDRTIPPLEARLRRALANTSDRPPRPITDLDMPLKMHKLLTPRLLRSLRAAAVLVPVIRRGDSLSVLLTVRSDKLRSHKGQISFPGGHRDETDTSVAGNALREAHEEVGLLPESVEVLGYLDDYPTITRYLVTPVVGMIHGEPKLALHAHEVAEVFEAPLSFVTDERSFERKALSRDGLNVPFFDWRHLDELWDKLAEEVLELKAAAKESRDAAEDELGDLLFMAVNLARHLHVDPAAAMARANGKFNRRFAHILRHLDKVPALGDPGRLEAMEAFWQEAKREEKKR